MFVTLVRHGATAQNEAHILEGHSSTHLSKLGKQQSMFAASHLGKKSVTAVYSSTARRAEETAVIISTQLKIPFRTNANLNERHYGPFDKLSRPDLLARRTKLGLSNLDPTQDWDGVSDVESDSSIWTRLKPFIEEDSQGHMVLVTHNGVIRAVLHTIFQIPAKRSRCFRLSNGCVVSLRRVGDCLELIELWQTPSDSAE